MAGNNNSENLTLKDIMRNSELSREFREFIIKKICTTKPGETIFEAYTFTPHMVEMYENALTERKVPYNRVELGIDIKFIRK